MDEVRIVRHRTHVWPVIIALIVLALVIAYVFFSKSGPATVGQVPLDPAYVVSWVGRVPLDPPGAPAYFV